MRRDLINLFARPAGASIGGVNIGNISGLSGGSSAPTSSPMFIPAILPQIAPMPATPAPATVLAALRTTCSQWQSNPSMQIALVQGVLAGGSLPGMTGYSALSTAQRTSLVTATIAAVTGYCAAQTDAAKRAQMANQGLVDRFAQSQAPVSQELLPSSTPVTDTSGYMPSANQQTSASQQPVTGLLQPVAGLPLAAWIGLGVAGVGVLGGIAWMLMPKGGKPGRSSSRRGSSRPSSRRSSRRSRR